MSKETLPMAEIEKPVGDFILDKHDTMLHNGAWYHYNNVCNLLKQYRDLHTSALQKELEEIATWKASAMEVFKKLNLPLIGKELDVKLGVDISEGVLPGVKGLKKQLEEKEQIINKQLESNLNLVFENEKLREALEWYADSKNYLSLENVISKTHTFEVERKAKEALKQKGL